MKTKEIIDLEENNRTNIYLIKEGFFWKAYLYSAYQFVTHIHSYKILKKRNKLIDQTIVSIGFPDSVLQKHLEPFANNRLEQRNEKMWLIKGFQDIRTDLFQEWLNEHQITRDGEKATSLCEEIINKIRVFPLINKTPLDTQQFVWSLQKQINGTL